MRGWLRARSPLPNLLDGAEMADEVQAGDAGDVAFGPAAAEQFGDEVGEAADVFEAGGLWKPIGKGC